MPTPIEFYFDFISPFGYLGSIQIERVATKRGRVVDWRPILLGVTVLKIMGMKPLPQTPLKGPWLDRDLERLSSLFDIPIRKHGLKGINSLAACRAFLWIKARDPALAKRFGQAIFHRLWRRGEDITAVADVVVEAVALGVDGGALAAALETPEAKAALNSCVEAAVAKGVFGAPFFIADGEGFFGNDHVWMLEHWLEHHHFNPA
jgi:2-hydroxychromene-2-carboxylate isomerase